MQRRQKEAKKKTRRSKGERERERGREGEKPINGKKKRKNKNDYLYKIVCIIDNLMQVFFKIDYVKQKKICYYAKINRKI